MAEINEQPEEGVKTFTQAEVDAIIGRRLAEERKKFPTAEEMAAYSAYKAAQETDADKLANITAERDTARQALQEAQAEAEKLRNEKVLLGKGVAEDDLEYFDFKIRKMVSTEKTYEQAAAEFIATQQNHVRVDMGGGLGGNNVPQTPAAQFNDLIRRAAKRN